MPNRYEYHVDFSNKNTTPGFIFDQVRPGDAILDLGAGPGAISAALREAGHTVVAVDRNPEALEAHRQRGLDSVSLDLEAGDLKVAFAGRHFGCVLLCDVLEHMMDPQAFLKRLSALASSFDQVVVTIPNASYLGVVAELLEDRFEYRDAGILDRTHMRFFTEHSFRAMAAECGFEVLAHRALLQPLPSIEFPDVGPISGILASGGLPHRNALTYQHCFLLRCAAEEAPEQAGWVDTRVSVVIRTVEGRLPHLDQALFSLLGQHYPDLEVIVVFQGVDELYHQALEHLLDQYRHDGLAIRLLCNPTREDQRAHNLNLGLEAVCGRYVAFLDDDDVVYPEHYTELVEILRSSEAAWAYSNTVLVNGESDARGAFYAVSHEHPFDRPAYDFFAHWLENFIPIHSFMVDRQRVPDGLLHFDERFLRLEDYAFLLKLAASFRPAFNPKVTCGYRIRLDGSNSVMLGRSDEQSASLKEQIWSQARSLMEEVKRQITPVAWMVELLERHHTLYLIETQLSTERALSARLRATFGVPAGETEFAKPPRYRLADQLNQMARAIPGLHWLAKRGGILASDMMRLARRSLRLRPGE